MTRDEIYMARCIQLARNGELGAAPNPMVGAVIVKQGRIIGEGYHIRAGGPHAEVNAFNSIKQPCLLKDATLYVCLEPCAHWGKTPPCAELVVNKGVGRVVVGCVDPFARVQGRGIKIMREAGIEVVVGVLERECQELNKKFFTFHTKKRPFITLKWAETSDGFIGVMPHLSMLERGESKLPRMIVSSAWTMRRGHRLRATHQAILVGYHTALSDDPTLTVRQVDGPNPLRMVIDREGTLPRHLKIFNDEAETLVCRSIEEALSALYERNVLSLLVEGGCKTLQEFLDRDLWDEVHREVSEWGSQNPSLFDEKTDREALKRMAWVRAPRLGVAPVCEEKMGRSTIFHYKNDNNVAVSTPHQK